MHPSVDSLDIIGVLFPALIAAYFLIVRPWHLRWGATNKEAGRALPGDERVPHPAVQHTHAITVGAPPAAVWPWLVQLGCNRGGWYSYDRLDNGGRPSAVLCCSPACSSSSRSASSWSGRCSSI